MRVGVALFMENYADWDRFNAADTSRPPQPADADAYTDELRIGDLVEPLGFDAIWTVEHHFSPYLMVPNPLQLLSYYAGKTQRIDFGTMVVVLPWHHPLRVAEEISVLDNLLQGRRLTVGLGRGAGRREFDPFHVPMSETRARFDEALDIVRTALTQERFSYEGQFFQIPETSIRPRPRTPDLVDRMAIAWQSPSTLEIGANHGLGMLFVNNKTWEEYADDVTGFNRIRAGHGWDPVQPTVVTWVSCAETEEEAWQTARTYMGEHQDSGRLHYELDDEAHFRAAGSYEFYAERARQVAATDPQERIDAFCRAQVYGTPEQCLERLRHIQRQTSAQEFILRFKFGQMPADLAERNIRLFAGTVLPHLHTLEPQLASAGAS